MYPEKLRAIVADNIKRICAEKGLSLSRLAELAGVSHATVTWAAKSQSSLTLDSLAKLSEALEVLPADLLLPHGGKLVEMQETMRASPLFEREPLLTRPKPKPKKR